ncbi:MAG: winged helix-turn-helix transcriptional regulator [Chloroflexi bacterium]|nr:winged helix-turn-helix transcriptional regulator [Chloroflexota bacterium]
MAEPGERLSGRELETLQAAAEGLANKEIAQKLHISPNTVKVHLRNVYIKLEANSRTEAVTIALQQGVLSLPGQEETTETAADLAAPALAEPIIETEPETATSAALSTGVSPPRSFLNRPEIILVLVTIAATLIGFFSWQTLSAPETPTPDPFVAEPIGETRWLRHHPMPEGRAGMAVAAVGLDVYAIGGETAVGATNSAAVYNTAEHIWREAAAKPTAVSDITAAVLFGEIYAPGGKLADGSVTAVVEAYSPANNAWRPIAALPQPLAGGLTLTDGSFLYLFGGWNGDEYLDTVYVYDSAGDSWRPLPLMSQPRAYAAGAFVSGQFYVVGGYDGSELALCQSYDPAAEIWADCPDMLIPRAYAGAATLLNKLYIFGGGLDETGAAAYSELFDPADQTWQVVNSPNLAETSAWTRLGASNVETRIFVLGGRRGGEPSAETLVYAPFVYQTFIPAAAAGQ